MRPRPLKPSNEDLYRIVVDTIPDLIWLKDQDGVYLSCNPTFERFFGAKESAIVGKTDYDFVPKELADFFRAHDRKAMEADGPSTNEEWLTFADGGYRGLFETIKTPMRDLEGSLIGVLGIARNITARKHAEDALKENEQRYKMAQRMGQVGNWEYDMATQHFWGSDEAKRIYGFDPQSDKFTTEEVEGCILEREMAHQALMDLIENNAPYRLELEIRPVAGPKRRVIKSIAEVMRDDDGVPVKVVGVIQDFSRQKAIEKEKAQLETQLRRAQKLESIGILAGGIAHDFNNILASIIGFTELALEDAAGNSTQEDNLQEVLIAGKRAKVLVGQMLDFARQTDAERRPIRVGSLVGEVLKDLRASVPATIDIQAVIGSESLILGTPSQVAQILMNLCTNAAQAMEATGGVLAVTVKDVSVDSAVGRAPLDLKPGDYLHISVADSGPGIPPAIRDRIFDPFFTTKTVGQGTGMGLAVVHGIVEDYGGKLTMKSRMGKGTTFTVCLPIVQNRQTPVARESERFPTGSKRILLVDKKKESTYGIRINRR